MNKNCIAIALGLLITLVTPTRAQLKDGDVVAICGDSITEQRIYSVFMEDYFLMCQPQQNLNAMNHGWSGQSTWDFAPRMMNDTLRYQPTVATTCFGMNDGGYAPFNEARATRYRENTQAMIDTFKKAGVRFIVIGSSGVVDTKTFQQNATRPADAITYNKTLGQFCDIAKELAEKNGVAFADLVTPMRQVMEKAKARYGPAYSIAGTDGIHPQANGHLVMAYAFLKALGCNGEIGTITVDLSGNKASGTAGHQVLSASNGIIEIESTRYPFCFSGEPSSSNATTGVIEFIPFNEDLNRYKLIVNNPGAEKLKVTWGQKSKEFTAAQLAGGINLAAEFLDNPFADFFKAVDQAVRKQQAYETPMIKQYVHSMPITFLPMVPPDGQKKLEEVAEMMEQERQKLAAEARKAVIPVKHTIKIEKAG